MGGSHVHQPLHDATKCECCNLNQIIEDSWEFVDEPKRLQFTGSKKPRTWTTCCCSNKTAAHRAAAHQCCESWIQNHMSSITDDKFHSFLGFVCWFNCKLVSLRPAVAQELCSEAPKLFTWFDSNVKHLWLLTSTPKMLLSSWARFVC